MDVLTDRKIDSERNVRQSAWDNDRIWQGRAANDTKVIIHKNKSGSGCDKSDEANEAVLFEAQTI